MLTDGYENYCRELVDNATGLEAPSMVDLCACAEVEHMPKSNSLTLPE